MHRTTRNMKAKARKTMKNFEKYKTADERAHAFDNFCNGRTPCDKCKLNNSAAKRLGCAYAWLDLEVEEEKPMPCPFCGKECSSSVCREDNCGVVACNYCGYRSSHTATREGAILNHNRICRAVAAYNKSEVKG